MRTNRRKMIRAALLALLGISAAGQTFAQPPWGDGPPPWAGRDGGGGAFGGPPGGGPPGGPMGGPPGGGDRGSRGGFDRGGFDPGRMLRQLDTNGNQMIDMDEMQGPARFMIERMARDNPSIDINKPVSIDKITKAIESRMRGDSGSSSSGSSGSGDSPDNTPASKEPEPLVPGFGISDAPEPIPGFGQDADKYSVKIEERDLQEAADRISRYDKNKDGLIDESELKDGRWSDNPMQYDRNRDNKLNKQELAVRYARRRVSSDEGTTKKESSTASKYSRNKTEEKPEVVDPWKAQAHYRITPKTGKFAKVQGVQGWFTTSDADGDGQVMMHEFASNWDDSTVQEFRRFDTNSDGTITTAGLLAAVKNGVMRGSGGGSSSASVASGQVSVSTGSASTSASPPAGSGGFDRAGVDDAKWGSFLEKGMVAIDRDKNKRITADEWPASNGEFSKVDANQDGVVSMLEWYNVRKKP